MTRSERIKRPENGGTCVIEPVLVRDTDVTRADQVFLEVSRAAAAARDLEETTALVHAVVGFDREPVEEALAMCEAALASGDTANKTTMLRVQQLLQGVLASGLWK